MNEGGEFIPNEVRTSIDRLELRGFDEPGSLQAAQFALDLIGAKLTPEQLKKLAGVVISVGDDLTDSGGLADAKNNTVVLDKIKNNFSLSEVEPWLVEQGFLNPGDWTKTMAEDSVNSKWSTLTYQLIHELGHIVDGRSVGVKYMRLDPSLSPTKYGSGDASEAFAEAFAHYVLGAPTGEAVKDVLDKTIASEIDLPRLEINE